VRGGGISFTGCFNDGSIERPILGLESFMSLFCSSTANIVLVKEKGAY